MTTDPDFLWRLGFEETGRRVDETYRRITDDDGQTDDV